MTLSNLEICKKIAEIEGAVRTEVLVCDTTNKETLVAFFCLGKDFSYQKPIANYGYNPLASDSESFQLMLKHKVVLTYSETSLRRAFL